MTSIARLIVRLVVGGLLAGHGAQKLFGWYGGQGLEGTAGWLESMRLRPGRTWAAIAGGSEFGGGLLTALGALNPLGPIVAIGAMLMATFKVHLGKPIWVTKGGAELPLTNIAALSAIALVGPGRLSVDGLLGTRAPRWLTIGALAGLAGAVAIGAGPELEAGTSELPDEEADAEEPVAGEDEAADVEPTESVVIEPVGIDAAAFVGESGADAGTAMGGGGTLGSETPDETV